jgi:multidrug resistance protein, MATE family
MSGNIRIGHYLGSKKPHEANTAARVLLTMSIFSGFIFSGIIFGLSKYIPHIFTKDQEIINIAKNVVKMVAILHIFDSIQVRIFVILKHLSINLFSF